MNNFSTYYKKNFERVLLPHGYKLCKSVFFKNIIDETICIFIYATKPVHSNDIEVYIDSVPYCLNLKTIKYDPHEAGIILTSFYKVLISEKLSLEFMLERSFVQNSNQIPGILNTLCVDIENLILPYIHKFTDFNYFYEELIKLYMASGCHDLSSCLKQDILYWLSIKLYKYENALHFVNFQLSRLNNIIEESSRRLSELKKGNIAGSFGEAFSQDSMDLLVSTILKRKPNFIEAQTRTSEITIQKSKDEIDQFERIKEALLSNDHYYLDNLVRENEKTSREYIIQMTVD